MTHNPQDSIRDTIANKKVEQVRLMEAEFDCGAQRIKVLESQLSELKNVAPHGKWANLNEQTIKHIHTKILAEQMRLLDLNARIEAIQPSF
jgi:16S rRNA U516 pseudouridylate synthase RsuA-like enzyme